MSGRPWSHLQRAVLSTLGHWKVAELATRAPSTPLQKLNASANTLSKHRIHTFSSSCFLAFLFLARFRSTSILVANFILHAPRAPSRLRRSARASPQDSFVRKIAGYDRAGRRFLRHASESPCPLPYNGEASRIVLCESVTPNKCVRFFFLGRPRMK